MENCRFTPAEAKVLMGLLERQHDSDRAIAEGLGMAPSNFAVVKKRLEARGVLEERVTLNITKVPDAKVAAFVWLEYSRPVREKYAPRLAAKVKTLLPIAHSFGGKDWSLDICYFRSFDEAETARLKFSEVLHETVGEHVANFRWKFVPLGHLSIYAFHNRLARYAFTHEAERVANIKEAGVVEHSTGSEAPVHLNDTEKRVLFALRKYPGAQRSEIAKIVGIQQSSLSEISKRLGRKGVVVANRMPDPKKLPDRNMAVFSWIDLARPLPEEEYKRLLAEVVNKTPQLHKIYFSRTFILMIALFHSLEKAENSSLFMLELFGNDIKAFNFKIVPCKHLQTLHPSLFLEKLWDISL